MWYYDVFVRIVIATEIGRGMEDWMNALREAVSISGHQSHNGPTCTNRKNIPAALVDVPVH
jgi:hypothetical protein